MLLPTGAIHANQNWYDYANTQTATHHAAHQTAIAVSSSSFVHLAES